MKCTAIQADIRASGCSRLKVSDLRDNRTKKDGKILVRKEGLTL